MSPANSPTKMFSTSNHWLVVDLPLRKILYSQLGWFFQIYIYGNITNVPNHQPEIIYLQYRSLKVHRDLQAAVVRCFKKKLGVHTAGHKKTKRQLSRGDHDFHHFPPHEMHFLKYISLRWHGQNQSIQCIPAVSKFGGLYYILMFAIMLKKQISLQYPLVNKRNYGTSPFLMVKSTINGPFSIATLNYQRENISHIGDVWRTKRNKPRLQVARFLGCIHLEDWHLPWKILAHMLHVWHIMAYYWWFNPSEKYESHMGRIVPYMMENKQCSKTTNQIIFNLGDLYGKCCLKNP